MIGRASAPRVDRPEPAQPQRCDACGSTDNDVETIEVDGVVVTVCVAVTLCRWREVKAA